MKNPNFTYLISSQETKFRSCRCRATCFWKNGTDRSFQVTSLTTSPRSMELTPLHEPTEQTYHSRTKASMLNFMTGAESWITNYFKIDERNSTILQEIRAGTATFLTMSYILLINPQLLSKLGVAPTDVAISTALSAAVGSLVVGIYGNLPFGLASGVGLSAYLTYGLVSGEGMTVSEAFTSCLIAGVILLMFAVTGVSRLIMAVIPHSVKIGTIVGMGLQIALVGMASVNLVVESNVSLVALGDIRSYKIWLAILGVITIGTFIYHRIKGGILAGILIVSILTWSIEKSFPSDYIQMPVLTASLSDHINFDGFRWQKCASAIAAFVFIGIIDVSGVVFGMARLANLATDDDTVPGSFYCFLAVSISTMLGACMGTTPVIVYVESAAGIKEGGRTGLTAVVVSVYFFLSLFFAPLFSSIPATATAAVSILVGVLMMSQVSEIDWEDLSKAIPAFLTMALIPFTCSIANGILFGLISALFFYVSTGKMYQDLNRDRTLPNSGYAPIPGISQLALDHLMHVRNVQATK